MQSASPIHERVRSMRSHRAPRRRATILRLPATGHYYKQVARNYNVHLMIDLYNNDTRQLIGSITEAELQVLVDRLEEESKTDRDYYIDRATIDLLGDGTATDHLLQTLRDALGSADGVEIRWERR